MFYFLHAKYYPIHCFLSCIKLCHNGHTSDYVLLLIVTCVSLQSQKLFENCNSYNSTSKFNRVKPDFLNFDGVPNELEKESG